MRAGALHSKGFLWPSPQSESCKAIKCVIYAFAVLLFILTAQAQTAVENESFINNPKYLNNAEIGSLFAELQRQYPHLARAYSIGKTLQNRDINVLALSAPGDDISVGDLLKPVVKLTANIHGDETLGRQMVLYLAQYLTFNYAKIPEIQELLNTTEIHFLPSCNPDGFAAAKTICEKIGDLFDII